ncbi:MAG: exosortase system-associated protein, TIGR04073 family [Candidatus Omnitrophica bacterium]|nr:exosortase system-associated protein, TIGR04073 family [Candidatus Omnitrophota bacterium]MBL7151332.1 exosortase system-associated protein, TIGR04073 family [Candidatus Omnitrophota bacterium]
MKRIFVFILAVIFMMPATTAIYAQGGQDALMGLTPYKLPLPRSEQPQPPETSAFLREVNADYIYYNNSPVTKGSEGLINATTFWAEVPKEVYDTTADSNILNGITFGFARGLIYGFGRGVAGVVDTTTFIMPPYDEPLVEPQYKVKNPDRDGFKITLFSW